MDGQISASMLQAELCKTSLRNNGAEMERLDGVDDDNTLAESGVYNTYHSLRDIFESLKQSVNADADNIPVIVQKLEESDSEAANAFQPR